MMHKVHPQPLADDRSSARAEEASRSQSKVQNPKSQILKVRNLHKTYRLGRVDVPVLKGVDLEVARGEWVAVLGASGCGKSTLLHLLGDLDTPDAGAGTIEFAGRDLATLSLHERNRFRNETIGFVFQFYHLLPELNVLENAMLHALVRPTLRPPAQWALLVAASALGGAVGAVGIAAVASVPMSGAEWWRALVIAFGGAIASCLLGALLFTEIQSLRMRLSARHRGLRERAAALLQSFGLGHRLRHRPRELSGGERQRVAIARALMNEPEILLADEPTGNLDEKTGEEILDLIAAQHRKGLTIVMVTHDDKIARRADRVVRLHDGRVQ